MKKSTHTSNSGHGQFALIKTALLSGACISAMAVAMPAHAQSAEDTVTDADEIVVVGTRRVIQDSIALKRNSTQVVDGLSADEIGDLPALSIGEALESITGVASHRENGGATEVSIRGLGPYLSSTTINGRLVGNGSGDRSVNFSQFPSELMNKLAVFKSQDASQIEGGVAGQIQIETLKPLDFGKRRIQGEIKGNINPDQLNQKDTLAGDIGFRVTGSVIEQFETGIGDIGVSLGAQISSISQPEAESRSTSNFGSSSFACIVRPNPEEEIGIGFSNNPIESNRDCEDYRSPRPVDDISNIGVITDINPLTADDERLDDNLQVQADALNNTDFSAPFVLVPSQRLFRQNDTLDERDALFAAVQWQPNDRIDINLDAQWSERSQRENRNDVSFNGWKRNDSSLPGLPGFESNPSSVDVLEFTDSGAITYAVTENTLDVMGSEYQRVETFEGIGLDGEFEINDKWTVSADVAYSKVERTEDETAFRFQSDKSPTIVYDRRDGGVPTYSLLDEQFDPNNHANYVDRLRVRIDNDLFRKNAFKSGRFDVDYNFDSFGITNVEAGVRFAEQRFISTPGGEESFSGRNGRTSFEIENDGEFTYNNVEIVDDADSRSSEFDAFWDTQDDFFVDIIAQTNEACRGEFPESDFLGNLSDGDLINFINSNGEAASTSSWAVFDTNCVVRTSVSAVNANLDAINALGIRVQNATDGTGTSSSDQIDGSTSTPNLQIPGPISAELPTLVQNNSRTINVQEDTLALYAMANYETTFQDLPVRGNFGLRVVNTEVTSKSFRQGYEITENGGEFSIAEVGDAIPVSSVSDYTEFLPSITAIVDIADDKLLRFGAFRAISRADPADMGFDREFVVQNGDDENPITSRNQLIASVDATGNPSVGPLTSWNYDAGFEWYPDADSILAISAYYKEFAGGFQNVVQNETFLVDGQTITRPVSGIQQVNDDESSLYGIEFTGSHRFSYLPGYLSGLGAKISYNYVNSDFEFEDSLLGDVFEEQLDGSIVQTKRGIVAPGNLPGLSENVFSGTLYYQIGKLDTSLIYKYRDNYFQPATSNGTRLRYISDVGVLEARAAYKLTDNWRLSVEGINLLDAEKEQSSWVQDNAYEFNSYGPRIFFGIRGRF